MGRHRINSSGGNGTGSNVSSSAGSLRATGSAFESRSPSRSQSRSRSERERDSRKGSVNSSKLASVFSRHGSGTWPKHRLLSLYELLKIELNLPDDLQRPKTSEATNVEADISYQELVNMVQVPYHLERFMIFGLLVCFNSFLTIFTLVPLKIVTVTYSYTRQLLQSRDLTQYLKCKGSSRSLLRDNFKWIRRDVLTLLLIACSVSILSSSRLDISRMYHDVRGQTQIKLYVMFGVLEVADKLCSSLGRDILNIFHRVSSEEPNPRQRATSIAFFILSLFYLSCHGYILIYQTVSLNVAANSYSNALMALLLSNQFSELKGSVFKKFEREGLFQLTMADLTERFQLSLMLGIIATRNLIQLHSNQLGLIPNSWKSWNTWIGAIFGPGIVVIGSEIFVDWLKHCYITKFNKFKPRVYRNFLHVLSLDFLQVFKSNSDANLSHELVDYIALTKRIGLPLLANIVCFLRMTLADFAHVFTFPVITPLVVLWNALIIGAIYAVLLFSRLMLGLAILKLANSVKAEHAAQLKSLNTQSLPAPLSRSVQNSPIHLHTVPALEPPKFELNSLLHALDLKLDPPAPPQILPFRSSSPRRKYSVDSLDSNKDNGQEKENQKLHKQKSDTGASKLRVDQNLENISEVARNHKLEKLPEPKLKKLEIWPKQTSQTGSLHSSETASPEITSPVELSFIPGIPNSEASSINPTTRSYLYDVGEKIPPNPEERRNKQLLQKEAKLDDVLGSVMRYEMSSKRIW